MSSPAAATAAPGARRARSPQPPAGPGAPAGAHPRLAGGAEEQLQGRFHLKSHRETLGLCSYMQRAEICGTCSQERVQEVWVKKPIIVRTQGAGGLLLTLFHHRNLAISLKTGGTFKKNAQAECHSQVVAQLTQTEKCSTATT